MPVQVRFRQIRPEDMKYKTINSMNNFAKLTMMPDYEIYWASENKRLGSQRVSPEPIQHRLKLSGFFTMTVKTDGHL